jgi:hypothetical protein
MKNLLLITASLLLGCIHAQNAQAASLWEHNGSTVSLVADGENRQFSYEEPRPGMVEAGAHLGSVLFTGKSLNGSYVGTAYIFNAHCGQTPYQVSGPILDRHERVVLKGQAPRLDSDCNIVGYVSDILEFSLFKSAISWATQIKTVAFRMFATGFGPKSLYCYLLSNRIGFDLA